MITCLELVRNCIRIFVKYTSNLCRDEPKVEPDFLLALSVKALNDTARPRSLVPILFFFGVMPKLPTSTKRDHLSQIERFRVASAGRYEYEKIISKERVQLALRKKEPPAHDKKYQPGDFVYVYREGIKQYTGPHMVAHMGKEFDCTSVNVRDLVCSTKLK